MSISPWICQRCLSRTFRLLSRRWIRLQSTASITDDTISPALLSQARKLSDEHATLSKQLSNGFNSRVAKKVGELSRVASAFKEHQKALESLSELRSLIHDPTTDAELRALAADDLISTREALSSASQSLTTSLVPQHPFAHLPCMLEIRPGAGGSEAALFAADLLRMYQSYTSRLGLRTTLLKYEDADGIGDPNGSDAPLQEAVLEIASEGAYGTFRCEAGVHRVQRVPATESKGRTHTSAASVLVLPSFPSSGEDSELNFEDPESDYYIDAKEVRTDIMRARGAGGQHVNTTDSAVRLTHLPTGTVVAIQDSRSQVKNREKAWALLRSKIAQARREAREEEMVRLRRSVVGVAKMGRGDKVRTYNWGQQRVTDHRSGFSVHDLDDVVEGGESLERVMESVRIWLSERDVEDLIASQEAEEGK
ncbi:peptide chain release factor 1 [Patellaria atrata CBS 101060]|uniref:Peptide chain release factor 1 n=1 Tax=Patellaria atrata CBS 101060 TaxID=1346257 RepID=A0A9P4SCD4_9PEZI|nr:peptide chain release factor 1 [Patellaria atrata CBS 101060]